MNPPMLVSAASAFVGLLPRVADLAELAWAIGEVFKSLEVLAMLLLVWLIFDRLAPAKGPPVQSDEDTKEISFVVVGVARKMKPTTEVANRIRDQCNKNNIGQVFVLIDNWNEYDPFISPGIQISQDVAQWALRWAKEALQEGNIPIKELRNNLQKDINFTPSKCRTVTTALNLTCEIDTKNTLKEMGLIDAMYDDYTQLVFGVFFVDHLGCPAHKKIMEHVIKKRI